MLINCFQTHNLDGDFSQSVNFKLLWQGLEEADLVLIGIWGEGGVEGWDLWSLEEDT
jgi:hypothetical protein